ncbi:MAG: hypothetical protein DRP45_00345 [Candidatus Zixiibacteriota bacterium]|nr:MAG: hypothetical protein DRP45_00345 [candidate division Zixibacteria bacterium]
MVALLLSLKRKLKRLLKIQAESRQVYEPTARSKSLKILMLILASLAVGILYPGEVLYDPLDMPRQGEFAPYDIVAPVQITVLKSDREMQTEQEQVRQFTSFVLDVDTTVPLAIINRLGLFAAMVTDFKSRDSLTRSVELSQFTDSILRVFPDMGQNALNAALADDFEIEPLRERLESICLDEIYRVGVLSDLRELPESRNRSILVRRGDKEYIVERGRLVDVVLSYARLLTTLNRQAVTDSISVDSYYSIGRSFIKPNLTVNMVEYERRVSEGLVDLSNVKEIVAAGNVIVSARQKVTERQAEVLQELAQVLRSQAAVRGWFVSLWPPLARVLLTLAMFTALLLFLYFFRPDVYRSNQKLLALFLIFGIQMFLLYLAEFLGLKSIYIYPIVVLSIMTTVLYDAEVGILSTVILALLLGIMHRFSFSLVFLTVVVGVVGCFTSQQLSKRSHFYRVMFSAVLAYLLYILVIENLKLSTSSEILTEMVHGLFAGVFSVLLTLGLLPIFESLFGITTDITLLELSDLNHPLLKRLSIEAPGTYHHSISVGNLCEAAAEAIGANALLARVGAYYHDIGKIEIPEYFVENQFSVKSKHESLTPAMSSMVLSSHVKKGRQLGEEADIPDAVLNFIEEHHGTMAITYFYHKAKEQEGGEVDINKYRYAGPKPQVRETGIAMLADAVEAASRTLEDPKPARIDRLIQKIINDRFQSGELDECPLTLRDLARIKEAFSQVLMAAFHHRVKYPAGYNA